ncbi:MAG: hypothetical protein LWY06_12265 [Firmicutes bacterium]|nr:hypothetical protein [Bacillota bacterium]
MNSYIAAMVFVALAFGILNASEGETGLMYSEYGCYILTAPDGWVLGSASAKGIPILAVFYPKGQSYKDAKAIFYTTIFPKHGKNIDQIIQGDISDFSSQHPQAKVTKESDLKTCEGSKVIVYTFVGDKWGNHDRIAYVDMPEMVVVVALQAKNTNAHDQALSAFEKLVNSFKPAANLKATEEEP